MRKRERGTLLLFLATIEWCWRSGKRDGGVLRIEVGKSKAGVCRGETRN